MRMVNVHPRHGYYSAERSVFGARGDFVTAPEISQLFGEVSDISFSGASCLDDRSLFAELSANEFESFCDEGPTSGGIGSWPRDVDGRHFKGYRELLAGRLLIE